jgi:hypothetical protein
VGLFPPIRTAITTFWGENQQKVLQSRLFGVIIAIEHATSQGFSTGTADYAEGADLGVPEVAVGTLGGCLVNFGVYCICENLMVRRVRGVFVYIFTGTPDIFS